MDYEPLFRKLRKKEMLWKPPIYTAISSLFSASSLVNLLPLFSSVYYVITKRTSLSLYASTAYRFQSVCTNISAPDDKHAAAIMQQQQ
jgi:hypothetical protein